MHRDVERVSEKVVGPVRGACAVVLLVPVGGACAVVLPEGIDGVTCDAPTSVDRSARGIMGLHLQTPLLFHISRLAVLDRRLPCFHLLAAQVLAGCGCHGGVGKAGTRGRVSGVWIVPAGWLRARPPNGRQAIRVGRARWYGSPEAGSCAAYPFRGSGPLDVSLHPAPSNGRRRTTEHTPRTTEPSSVAWRAGTCDALGPSGRRGLGLTSQSR